MWQDVEGFIRDPGPVLQELGDRLGGLAGETEDLRREADAAAKALGTKDRERDSILALYRRGRIDEAALDRQLDAIERERGELQQGLQDLQERILGAADEGPVPGPGPPKRSSRA